VRLLADARRLPGEPKNEPAMIDDAGLFSQLDRIMSVADSRTASGLRKRTSVPITLIPYRHDLGCSLRKRPGSRRFRNPALGCGVDARARVRLAIEDIFDSQVSLGTHSLYSSWIGIPEAVTLAIKVHQIFFLILY
jgi:hypothetical protein